MPSYKYQILNDKQWLYDQYVVNKLSTNQIASLINCKASNTIRQALIRHGIGVRNVSDGLTINNDPITINASVIDGSLLGDGWLKRWNKTSDLSLPYFTKKNKYKDHVEYITNAILPTDSNYKCITPVINKCKENTFIYYQLKTPVSASLLSFYDRWYSTGSRQPPDDVVIDNISMLNWFLDDGSSYLRKRNSKTKQVTITLSCEGFTPERIQMLADKINVTTGLPFKKTKCNSGCGFRLTLTQKYTKQFYDYIGKCPVESFNYKWK